MNIKNKQVAQNNQIKYIKRIANIWLGNKTMAKQAKVLNQADLERVLGFIKNNKHAQRNRAMLLMTHLAGMRCGEVANLCYKDIVSNDGVIKEEIQLRAEQTKGNEGRLVFINARLRDELQHYIRIYQPKLTESKFFYSQKSVQGFTPNTLAQHFHYLYKRCGIDGASSHSGRRTFATQLAERGGGVRTLMGILGHKHITTTIKYVDGNVNTMKKAVEMVV